MMTMPTPTCPICKQAMYETYLGDYMCVGNNDTRAHDLYEIDRVTIATVRQYIATLEAENSALKAKLAELSRSKLDHGINTKLEYSLPKPPKDTIR